MENKSCLICSKNLNTDGSYVALYYPPPEVLLCFHCYVLSRRYLSDVSDRWSPEMVLAWVREEHPAAYASLKAHWRYPDGELMSLPLTLRCLRCKVGTTKGYEQYCLACTQELNEDQQKRLKEHHEKRQRDFKGG